MHTTFRIFINTSFYDCFDNFLSIHNTNLAGPLIFNYILSITGYLSLNLKLSLSFLFLRSFLELRLTFLILILSLKIHSLLISSEASRSVSLSDIFFCFILCRHLVDLPMGLITKPLVYRREPSLQSCLHD